MSVKLSTGGVALNVVCTYVPQAGSREVEKGEFYGTEKMEAIPHEERDNTEWECEKDPILILPKPLLLFLPQTC